MKLSILRRSVAGDAAGRVSSSVLSGLFLGVLLIQQTLAIPQFPGREGSDGSWATVDDNEPDEGNIFSNQEAGGGAQNTEVSPTIEVGMTAGDTGNTNTAAQAGGYSDYEEGPVGVDYPHNRETLEQLLEGTGIRIEDTIAEETKESLDSADNDIDGDNRLIDIRQWARENGVEQELGKADEDILPYKPNPDVKIRPLTDEDLADIQDYFAVEEPQWKRIFGKKPTDKENKAWGQKALAEIRDRVHKLPWYEQRYKEVMEQKQEETPESEIQISPSDKELLKKGGWIAISISQWNSFLEAAGGGKPGDKTASANSLLYQLLVTAKKFETYGDEIQKLAEYFIGVQPAAKVDLIPSTRVFFDLIRPVWNYNYVSPIRKQRKEDEQKESENIEKRKQTVLGKLLKQQEKEQKKKEQKKKQKQGTQDAALNEKEQKLEEIPTREEEEKEQDNPLKSTLEQQPYAWPVSTAPGEIAESGFIDIALDPNLTKDLKLQLERLFRVVYRENLANPASSYVILNDALFSHAFTLTHSINMEVDTFAMNQIVKASRTIWSFYNHGLVEEKYMPDFRRPPMYQPDRLRSTPGYGYVKYAKTKYGSLLVDETYDHNPEFCPYLTPAKTLALSRDEEELKLFIRMWASWYQMIHHYSFGLFPYLIELMIDLAALVNDVALNSINGETDPNKNQFGMLKYTSDDPDDPADAEMIELARLVRERPESTLGTFTTVPRQSRWENPFAMISNLGLYREVIKNPKNIGKNYRPFPVGEFWSGEKSDLDHSLSGYGSSELEYTMDVVDWRKLFPNYVYTEKK